MRPRITSSIILAAGAVASASPSWPASSSSSSSSRLDARQSSSECSALHIIGAREANADMGYGSTEPFVTMLLDNLPEVTAEPLKYPALGGDDYHASVSYGLGVLMNETQRIFDRCPETKMILVGYSTGAQIIDDVLCGGPDPPSLVTDTILMPPEIGKKIAAVIWFGNPRFIGGMPYNVGTAELGGFAARQEGFVCETYADRIRSYCDAGDLYCSQGDSELTHGTYPVKYGGSALRFIQQRLGINSTAGEPFETHGDRPSAGNWISRPSHGVGFLALGTTLALLLS
ncbi:alpha/beta-hydrolase [Sodiomyces alkalinus F11]|uniref:Alpha/beta-hydrolase n=1 Tax=Sodiomyces alkalinus (strain CBS 110278 / VKM F-3762 / F11) TaxID=1314773 RepID=A0A3N2PNF3_SODAK|nr:alpha/beta-hydrolase [Sodiomyces alkalinus F11]ROT36032.1 alpha/beta-hydrolase [Sodiomyces alkalinus F11]